MSNCNQVVQVAIAASKIADDAAITATTVTAVVSEDVTKENERIALQIDEFSRKNEELRKVLESLKVQQDLKEKLAEILRTNEELRQQIEDEKSEKPRPIIWSLGRDGRFITEREAKAEKEAEQIAKARDDANVAFWAQKCRDKERLAHC